MGGVNANKSCLGENSPRRAFEDISIMCLTKRGV